MKSPSDLKLAARRKHITSIQLYGKDVTDNVIARLHGHKHLRELHIVDAKRVTNAGLSYIENLLQLEWLNLDSIAINDRGLVFLQQMTRLRGLQLTETFVSSVGLEYLLSLKKLQYLDLEGTNVDDSGLRVLAKLKNLRTLRLSGTKVTDAGMKRLVSLKKLTTLALRQSLVTQAGLSQLQKLLPNCEISWSERQACQSKPYRIRMPQEKPVNIPQFRIATTYRYPPSTAHNNWQLNELANNLSALVERDLSANPRRTCFITRANFKSRQPDWFNLIDW